MILLIILLLAFSNLYSMQGNEIALSSTEEVVEQPVHKYSTWDTKELITLCNLLSTKSTILDLSTMVIKTPSKTIKNYITQETTTLEQNIKEAPESVAREYLAILVATTILAYKEFPQKYHQNTKTLEKNRLDYMSIIINNYITKLSRPPTIT